MSLDLTKFDVYNYDLYLRPDGQTTTGTSGAHNIPTGFTDNFLKSQILNIPNGFNFNPSHKVYFYLRNVRIGAVDACDICKTALTTDAGYNKDFGTILLSNQFYIKVNTTSQYNYGNFEYAEITDNKVQNCQPVPVLIPVDFKPVISQHDHVPVSSTLKTHLGLQLKEIVTATIRLDDDKNILLKDVALVDNAAPFDQDGDPLRVPTSYAQVPATLKFVPEVPPAGANPAVDAHKDIVNVGSGNELVGLVLDKGTNMFDRMACIGNPFGNSIEIQLVNVDLQTKYPTPLVNGGSTFFNTSTTSVELTNALLISFSILVQKENKY